MTTHHDETSRIRALLAFDRGALPPDGGERFNRLVFESSPYLLQHAENPVQWFPWGEAAFAAAREQDKPVFLSIGYATCHWCHVMAHESFEDPEVAAVINRHYVPVKVDREERPDVDDQYMLVSQMMTGSGGWPLTIIMTPDRQPFFAATYLPRQARMGMPGVVTVLENIATLWKERRDVILRNTSAVMEALALQTAEPTGEGKTAGLTVAAWGQLCRMYDPLWGGFGNAPKFPMPHYLSFLLLFGHRTKEPEAVRMAVRTLEIMRQGGICDQLGFGFHRYATDREWLVPHFEKMLYDQALIGDAALDAFRVTKEQRFLTMAGEIAEFVAAELTLPEGGFTAALDADSEGVEGRYYVWSPAEIRDVLGEGEGELFCRLFGVTEEGNFEGENILFLERPATEFVAAMGDTAAEIPALLPEWRRRLLEARARRVRPLRDEKVLTAWNGLMIAFLARAYAITGRGEYLAAADKGMAFVARESVTAEGRLIRSWHHGRQGPPAFLEDYAFLVRGCIELHQATLEGRYLEQALLFTRGMLHLFCDPGGGAFFDTGNDADTPLVRMKGITDGVIPSGNGVAAQNLIRLGWITGDEGMVNRGKDIVLASAGSLERSPVNHLQFLVAQDSLNDGPVEVTLFGNRHDPLFRQLLTTARRSPLPGLILRHQEGGETSHAHVCAAGSCRPPAADAGELEQLLDRLFA